MRTSEEIEDRVAKGIVLVADHYVRRIDEVAMFGVAG
jgi:hypothetical protein